MGFPSCEMEKDNFRDSQGKQIRTKNKESFEFKILKQKQHCVAVAFLNFMLILISFETSLLEIESVFSFTNNMV